MLAFSKPFDAAKVRAAYMPKGAEKKAGGKQIPSEELAKKTGKYRGFKVTKKQVADIAEKKKNDLGARDAEHASRIIEGTARSMGITVEG